MKVFNHTNLRFRSNTSQEIVDATLDMYKQLTSTQVLKPSEVNETDLTMAKLLRNIDPTQTMRVAPSFRSIISNLIE
jgi:chorismate mutase